MSKNDPQPDAAPEPVPEKTEPEEPDHKDPKEGFPPGVRFDTPAGRRAQGMDPDIGNPKPDEQTHKEEREQEHKD
jgi:hypothetical protein